VVKYAYPQTRTPIISQPVINNWVQFDKIDPGRATLVIEWARQNKNSALIKATQLSLKASNVVVIAVENLD